MSTTEGTDLSEYEVTLGINDGAIMHKVFARSAEGAARAVFKLWAIGRVFKSRELLSQCLHIYVTGSGDVDVDALIKEFEGVSYE